MTNFIIYHYKGKGNRDGRFDQMIVNEIKEKIDADVYAVHPPDGQSICAAGQLKAPIDAKDPHQKILCDDAVIIQDKISERFWIIDWQDPAHMTAQFGHSDLFAGATVAMYHMQWIAQHVPKFWRVRAGIYSSLYPSTNTSADRQNIPIADRDRRLFFAGTIGDEVPYQNPDGTPRRQAVRILQQRHPDDVVVWDRNEKKSRREWLDAAGKFRMNLALAGHPHCSRENDLFRIAAPVIMPELLNNVSVSLKPNQHYVAVPSDVRWGCGAAVDPEQLADDIWKTFAAARDDIPFLESVADEALQYWHREINPVFASIRLIEDVNWNLLLSERTL